MKFCSECAHPVTVAIPEGDNRPRYVCTECGTIHYQNPKMVIGSIPVWEKCGEQDGEFKVLLCKRAIEPRYGYWTLPAGFMENEETTGQAAVRETEEEAGANVELGNLFAEDEIPWDDLAFPTIRTTLELFFADRRKVLEGGSYGFHSRDITRPMRAPVEPD
jgi:ADP-ribose pyrophosphatase YjhB (NUDIX family)